MAVAYRSSAFAANTAATDQTSVTVTKPTGTVQGDAMFAIVSGYQSVSVTAPSGWNLLASAVDSGTALRVRTYTKLAGGSEPSNYTWTWSGTGGSISAIHITCSGVGTDFESFVSSSITDSTTADPSAANTYTMGTATGGLVFTGLCFHRNGTNSTTGGASWTEIQDFVRQDGAPGTNWRGQSAYMLTSGVPTASGATTPSNSIDLANAPANSVKWTIGIPDTVQATTGTPTHSGATGSGTAYEWPTGDGAAAHSGATGAGTAYEWPKAVGAAVHSGATASGVAAQIGTYFELFLDNAWVDYTQYIQNDPGVFIQRGLTDAESSYASQIATFRLFDKEDSSKFIITNPLSPLYGQWKRNTKVRITRLETGVRFVGEVAAVTPVLFDNGSKVGVDVEASGMFRRMEQGDPPIYSAIRRDIVYRYTTGTGSYGAKYYFPCEESVGAREFGQVFDFSIGEAPTGIFGTPLKISNAGLEGATVAASFGEIPASSSLAKIGASSWISPSLPSVEMDATGCTIGFLLVAPDGMSVGRNIFRVNGKSSTGENVFIDVRYSAANTLELYSIVWSGGSEGIVTDSGTLPGGGISKGVYCYLSINNTGATLWAQGLDDALPTEIATVAQAHTAVVPTVTVNPWAANLGDSESVYVGHIAAFTKFSLTVAANLPVLTSLAANAGEAAGERIERLCLEEGITFDGTGTMADTARMGAQLPDSFTELVKDCQKTDQGSLYELRDDFGVGYTALSAMYNQTPTATFDWSANEFLGDGFSPAIDDKGFVNKMTITREGGAEGTYTDNDSINSIGEYPSSDTVSLYNDLQAYQYAGWRVFKGTPKDARLKAVKVSLQMNEIQANPTLEAAILALECGNLAAFVNPPDWLTANEDMNQIVVGYTEEWNSMEYRFTFITTPAEPYTPAQADTGSYRAAATQAILGENLDTTETSITMSQAEWEYNDGDYDININGERMTVTGVASNVLTVIRSVNGVVREHDVMSPVHLWNRARVAL